MFFLMSSIYINISGIKFCPSGSWEGSSKPSGSPGGQHQDDPLSSALECENSPSTYNHKSVNRNVGCHFRNYLWLNNKQVLKALVSSFSPNFFSAQLPFALKAQLARKKKGCQRRARKEHEGWKLQVALKSEDESSVKRLCEKEDQVFFFGFSAAIDFIMFFVHLRQRTFSLLSMLFLLSSPVVLSSVSSTDILFVF